MELLLKMTPELLGEDYGTYQEGFDLTKQAVALEDTETILYYPVRLCAVCIFANVLDHIQKSALIIEDKAYDKNEHIRVRFSAKDAFRKHLKGRKSGVFR